MNKESLAELINSVSDPLNYRPALHSAAFEFCTLLNETAALSDRQTEVLYNGLINNQMNGVCDLLIYLEENGVLTDAQAETWHEVLSSENLLNRIPDALDYLVSQNALSNDCAEALYNISQTKEIEIEQDDMEL